MIMFHTVTKVAQNRSILPLYFRREIIDLCCMMASGLINMVCKTVQFQYIYFYRTARLWNALPFVIRDDNSLCIFKKNQIISRYEFT